MGLLLNIWWYEKHLKAKLWEMIKWEIPYGEKRLLTSIYPIVLADHTLNFKRFLGRSSLKNYVWRYSKGKVIGEGYVSNSFSKIQNVVVVDGLEHNLSTIAKLCDKRNMIAFESRMCLVQRDNKIFFVAYRKSMYT